MASVVAIVLSLLAGCAKTAQYGATSLLGRQPVLPGSLPSANEELWIITPGGSGDATHADAADTPGSGAMLATSEGKDVPLPLKHTDVQASVLGYIATVRVRQQFHNPFDAKIEARYVFPLPHNAAVNEFFMTIGERRIRAIIRERKEAEQIYETARRQGYVAALLSQGCSPAATSAAGSLR